MFRFRRVEVLLAPPLLLALAACGSSEPAPPPEPAPASERVLAQGHLIGADGDFETHVWRGVPFAKPPVGELRWRAPRPAERWQGTLEALENGAACSQFSSPFGGTNGEAANSPIGSEDCLFVNIFAPRFAPAEVPAAGKRLPVMLWIHGGGNTIGDVFPYNGSRLAGEHGLVIVTVQYRLGAFGWFTHPALRAEATRADDRSGNYGTLDLIRALAWIRENAAAFGGDPENVTIFGESAGGSDVFTLLASPLARGLFQRAIVESGGLGWSTLAEAESYADATLPGHPGSSREALLKLLQKDGAADTRAARTQLEKMSDAEIARYLRQKSASEILAAYEGGGLGGMYRLPTLIRDGHVLPDEEPLALFARKGGVARVPVILGTNRDETKLFQLFGSDLISRLFGIPLWPKDERAYDLAAEYPSNMWKAGGADQPAEAMRRTGNPNVFVYRFDWDEEPKVLWADLSKLLAAGHALEIPFVFGTFDLGPGNRFLWDENRIEGRDALSDAMRSYWSSFAHSGSPGRGEGGRLPAWVPWGLGERAPKFMVLDTAEGGGLRMSSEGVTVEGLLAAIPTDSRFMDDRERCGIYYSLAQRGRDLDRNGYAKVGGGICAPYPFDAYPWD